MGYHIDLVLCRVGMLAKLTSEQLKESFRNPADADAISTLADGYVEGIRTDTFKEQGYSPSMYAMSKICEMSYTRWLAGQVKDKVLTHNQSRAILLYFLYAIFTSFCERT